MNYSDKLKSIISNYKKSMDSPPDFSKGVYSFEYREQQTEKYFDKVKRDTLFDIKDLEEMTVKKITEKTNKINSLKYPLLSSYSQKQIGESQRSEALAISKEKNLKFDKIIDDAEKLSRYDFIYSLQDFISNNNDFPTDIKNEVNNSINPISEKRGLTGLSSDIENLNKFKELLTTHKNIISDPSPQNKTQLMYFGDIPEINEIA